MRLGQAVSELPKARTGHRNNKYDSVYAAVDKLKRNEWLPVKFDTAHEAYNFRVAVATHRSKLLDAKLRGSTVYVRNKPSTNGTKERGR